MTDVHHHPTGAMAGVVVADFSRVLAAPYATMVFGDLGADVIKIERPGLGDDTRHWGPPYTDDHEATYFLSVNRNKRSFTADMSNEADHRNLVELIRRADVLIENFRPGTMARHGLSYQQAAAINPRLVYCSVTGFGSTEAAAALPGYDLLVQAVGGLMSVTGPGPGFPVKAGVALVDVLTGLHAAVGVLAALRARETTGRGQLVEVNLLSTLLSSMVNQSVGYTAGGSVPGIIGNRHPSIAPYQLFPASDRPIVIAVGNDRQFGRLCAALGIPEAADDPRFTANASRVAHIDELDRLISTRTSGQTAGYWYGTLSACGVPCGPVNNIADAFAMAEELGLNPLVNVGGGNNAVSLPANPISMSETPVSYVRRPPRLGQDSDDVSAWLHGPVNAKLPQQPNHFSNSKQQPMGAHS
ncbi:MULTISPECIES: CaiB/BaiF CoA-transferase family protein [Paenarthrobacter]|uniref:CaiB/BaiF CoA transferase family protein n=1 Tax=Paenarthrobacter TaxID=1742992 RepID=UPI0009E9A504|nr:CoA transferase [Paenarthrobacter ureafaciens]RWW91490.1 CoA transferase [Paenarthrobacter ureafaciens]